MAGYVKSTDTPGERATRAAQARTRHGDELCAGLVLLLDALRRGVAR